LEAILKPLAQDDIGLANNFSLAAILVDTDIGRGTLTEGRAVDEAMVDHASSIRDGLAV
jgi:hypothetical protein